MESLLGFIVFVFAVYYLSPPVARFLGALPRHFNAALWEATPPQTAARLCILDELLRFGVTESKLPRHLIDGLVSGALTTTKDICTGKIESAPLHQISQDYARAAVRAISGLPLSEYERSLWELALGFQTMAEEFRDWKDLGRHV